MQNFNGKTLTISDIILDPRRLKIILEILRFGSQLRGSYRPRTPTNLTLVGKILTFYKSEQYSLVGQQVINPGKINIGDQGNRTTHQGARGRGLWEEGIEWVVEVEEIHENGVHWEILQDHHKFNSYSFIDLYCTKTQI